MKLVDEGRTMLEVGAFEVRNTLGALLYRVERREGIVIARHGKSVARLHCELPDPSRSVQRVKEAP